MIVVGNCGPKLTFRRGGLREAGLFDFWSRCPAADSTVRTREVADHDLHNRTAVATAIGKWNLASAIFAGILWKGSGAERQHPLGERGPTPGTPDGCRFSVS